MVLIFIFSAQPSSALPDFGLADFLVKKSAHMLVYALLASAYWYGFDGRPSKIWFAWGLAIVYALTDEYHQSFVNGRHPSLVDVFLFDNLGAVLALRYWHWRSRKSEPEI